MADGIIFNSINVNTLETNAIIGVGTTTASGWDSHQKNVMPIGLIFNAFGSFISFPYNYNYVFDPDYIDTPINDQDIEGPNVSSQV